MNERQKRCLWVGIAVFVLMGLFPPWDKGLEEGVHFEQSTRQGYTFLLTKGGLPIAMDMLAIQWAIVAVVTGGLIFTFRGKETQKTEIRSKECHQPGEGEPHTQ
jgi:hypothetical protein